MIFGGDYLGGKHFQSAMLKAHPKGWAGGIFLRTFGEATSTVRKMAASKKFSDLVVHLAPFDYSHKYPIAKFEKQVLKDAEMLESLARANPHTTILISPFCESNHKAESIFPLFKKLKQIAPSCALVHSIWQGEPVLGVITELHITSSKKLPKKPGGIYTIAFDGVGGDGDGDFPDLNVEEILKHYSDARHIRWWNFRCNGKFGHKDTTPLEKRKHWPDVHYLRGHHATMEARDGGLTWPNKMLYKPFADDHGSGGKDNKAMCILPIKQPTAKVSDINGKVIDIMKRLEPDHTGEPKGARYYSERYAYQISDIAQKNTGSSLITIEGSPYTDADLRSGRFR